MFHWCAAANTLLESAYIGSGEEQLSVQLWDKNKPNVTHTQVRTDPDDGLCYLVKETFSGEFPSARITVQYPVVTPVGNKIRRVSDAPFNKGEAPFKPTVFVCFTTATLGTHMLHGEE